MNAPSPTGNSTAPKPMPFRIVVVEDHPLMRKSLVECLEREPDLTVCGQAENATDALAMITSLQPNLVVTDIHLKTSSGLELIQSLRVRSPMIPLIATTMFDTGRTERLARAAGAAEFVCKQAGPEKLVATIRAVLKTDHSPEDQVA